MSFCSFLSAILKVCALFCFSYCLAAFLFFKVLSDGASKFFVPDSRAPKEPASRAQSVTFRVEFVLSGNTQREKRRVHNLRTKKKYTAILLLMGRNGLLQVCYSSLQSFFSPCINRHQSPSSKYCVYNLHCCNQGQISILKRNIHGNHVVRLKRTVIRDRSQRYKVSPTVRQCNIIHLAH